MKAIIRIVALNPVFSGKPVNSYRIYNIKIFFFQETLPGNVQLFFKDGVFFLTHFGVKPLGQ
jgi:hypothetical protein